MYPQSRRPPTYFSSVKKLFFSLVLLFMVHHSAYSQNEVVTPLGLKTTMPSASYQLTDIDSINLFNGRVDVRIPLINSRARGQSKLHRSWSWESPARWQVYTTDDGNGNQIWAAGFGMTPPLGNPTYGFHREDYSVYPLGTGSGLLTPCDPDNVFFAWEKTLTRLIWAEPDGTEHEMRDVVYGGEPRSSSGCSSGWHTVNRGRIFVSTDGSGATFVADADVRDGTYAAYEFPNAPDDVFKGWLLLKDGTRIRISWDANTSMRDRNGNQFKHPFPSWMYTWTDALNRSVGRGQGTSAECSALVPGATTCAYDSVKGFGGAERRFYYFYNDQNSLLTRLFLPNGRSYTLYYNNYDDLIRIDLPTGGSIEYEFEAGLQGNDGDWFPPTYNQYWPPGSYSDNNVGGHFYRRVIERRVYREGHVLESRQTFSKPETSHTSTVGYVEKKNYDGSNNLLSTERHYFYGNAEHSFWIRPTEYSSWKDGLEYKTETYDGNGNLMKTVLTSWEQRAPVSWWTGSSDDAPANDPRISQVTTVLENGAQFTNSYAYDPTVPYNSLIDVIERDYNLNILRRTQTTYLKTLNGVDYAGLNVQNSAALHIRNLPLQESIIDWGVEIARTTYEYDNYIADANHTLLVSRSNISGLDPTFTASYTTRGNVTGATRYLLSNGTVTGSVTSYMQYDVAGNIVKAIDARGNATTFDFTDHFGSPNAEAQANTSPSELSSVGQNSYAFPTLITNALNMTSFYQYDFYLGQAVDFQDVNGIVSSAYFNDPLDRPTQVIAAANNATLKTQNTFTYDDLYRVVTTLSDLTQYLDNQKKTETRFDGLGRRVEERTYETSSNYIVRKNSYSGLSSQVSNPYRPWQGETPQWTTTVVDALGRLKSVTAPDNATVTTSYTGNETTVTDPTGKKRKSISDSLGRIAYVYEDPLGVNYQTIYGYNALGNLISVYQDYLSQPPRAFVYDSLGRLVSATNPESGTTTFQYDAANNVLVKTDARAVSTHYAYDVLNRPTRRWYNGSNSTTATTHDSPAIPSAVGASFEANYFYDQQNLPSGAPTFTRGASNGSLVALTYGTGSSDGDYLGRDQIGRPSTKIQRTSGVNYQMSLSYNAVGDVTSLAYPSGRIVNYGYDGAGRLSSLTGNLGDGTSRTYSNNISYSPFGSLSREDFGTNTPLYHKSFYNIRGQLFDTRLSSVNDTWDWNRGRLILYYSSNHVWGQSGTDNNGNVRFAETWIPPANATLDQVDTLVEVAYTYDSLNRLSSVVEQKMSVAGGWGNWQQQFRQQYAYDRWGNRTIDPVQTWGTGINNKQFSVNPYYNRLGVPSGQTGVMTYDAAGNLTHDTYTGAGNRTYDAENKLISAWGGNNQAQLYVYDAAGERVKRTVNGVETWQVYGFSGESLAEYPVSGAASGPQKEYAYRNGELLVTAEAATIQWLVTDHLGTPRMIVDQAGTLASLKRRDYLPFGEELPAGVGGRTSVLGYNPDTTRQRFTGYDYDTETGLNYAEARYQSSVQGRFTSTDPVSGTIADPQSWNMYSYVGNNPINRTDPTGMSYFIGSGTNDPFIRENQYRVDGFDMSPQGTASNLTDESLASFSPHWALLNEGLEFAAPDPDGPVEIVIWEGTTNRGRDPASAFGHVSYIINGYSYSWEKWTNQETGKEEWRIMEPVAYINERREQSSGKGYVLDLGSEGKNRQFANAIINGYNGNPNYKFFTNNCGHAFQRAVNEMKLGGFWRNNSIRPSEHEKFIKYFLSDYIVRINNYSKGGHIN